MIKYFYFFCKWLNSSIWPIDGFLTGTTCQSEPGSNDNEGVLYIPPKLPDWSLTIICSLVSYAGHSFVKAVLHLWDLMRFCVLGILRLDCFFVFCVFYHSEFLGYCLHLHYYIPNVSADMSLGFLQVFLVELGSLHFEPRPLFNPWRLPALIPLTITGYKC